MFWVGYLVVSVLCGFILHYLLVFIVQRQEHAWLDESVEFLDLERVRTNYLDRLSYPQDKPALLNAWPFKDTGNVFYCAGCAWVLAALCFVGGIALSQQYGFSVGFYAGFVFVFIALLTSYIDYFNQIMPDILVQLLLWGGLLFNSFGAYMPVGYAVLSVCLSYLLLTAFRLGLSRLRGREVLGQGDIKYIAALSAWIGPGVLLALLVASVLFVLYALVLRALKQAEGLLAFGPSLSLGGFAVLCYGPWSSLELVGL